MMFIVLKTAQFSHAKLKVTEDGSPSKPPTFTRYRSSETKDPRKRNKQCLVATAEGEMEYIGQNFGPTASRSDSMCKYMVGVVDKTTNKIKVYDGQLFHLQPWIFLKESLNEGDEDVTDKKDLSFAEKSDMLTEAFGSARKQRAMESRIRNKVATDALEHSLRKAMEEAGSQPNTPTKLPAQETSDIIPACNRNATRPEEAYHMEDIISPSIMLSLKGACEFLTTATQNQIAEWKTNETYSPYVLSQLQVLTGTTEKRKERASQLLYMMYLIHMHCLKPFACRKGIPFMKGTPDAVKKHLLNEFTVEAMSPDGKKTLRNLSSKMRDKLALHMILIALYIDNFRVNLSLLQKELHLGSTK
ncbi:DNA-directed RNA polymerase I subunit RPA49-like isoform X2 [Anneissia japonica]|uniref:DNA-directed RNA polymerase I subunit RPA49-like isoform X2 n=1 Tax=Anneissia japonica TaxID=1529436 RepID=UPI0014255B99|nr:DNA-directed RNA polymerase I subunit RPA49-like isoform X2 [Anneissia japonica]